MADTIQVTVPSNIEPTSIATTAPPFLDVAQLITASSYLAGLGFSAASIMKFKQHKDNPTQIPVGTPAALLYVSAALLYLPTVMGIANTAGVEEKAEAAAADPAAIPAEVEAAAESAGVTSSEVAAAESTLKEKLSG
jgi:hypothetical protein